METTTPDVYRCVCEVQGMLAKEGIAKSRRNEQQKYQFRGIDDVYNALASCMAAVGLVIIPSYSERSVVERKSSTGGTLFVVSVVGKYEFVSRKDGSRFVAGPFFGEAMDSGDKATNKAMSASYKYMALQVFAIPTEGDNDADATTHKIDAWQQHVADWMSAIETADTLDGATELYRQAMAQCREQQDVKAAAMIKAKLLERPDAQAAKAAKAAA